jgi:hypothetical protein
MGGDPVLEPSTLIRKLITDLAEQHSGWSATRIAEHIDKTDKGLVDELFLTRRAYIFRWWVTNTVGEVRREVRDQLKTGEILAALSPDGNLRIHKLGDMTGYQVVALGERYIVSGSRLTSLGEWYVEIGEEAGGKKIKNVFTADELRTKQEEMGL